MEKKAIIKPQAFRGMTVRKIAFLDNNDDTPPYALDFSANGDRSVLGWEDFNKYILYIAPAYGNKIIAYADCSFMFNNCRNLTHISGLRNLDTSNVINMSSMFSYCDKLISLDLSRFDTSNVADMKCMFSRCRSLQKLDLSNFDTSNVWNINEIFYGCSNLEKLKFSINCKNINCSMSNMFTGCRKLKIAINNIDN